MDIYGPAGQEVTYHQLRQSMLGRHDLLARRHNLIESDVIVINMKHCMLEDPQLWG